MVLWIVSRTIGVPIGPDNGGTEPFGVLDLLASAAEVAVGTCGLLALRTFTETPAWRWTKWPVTIRCASPLCIGATLVASVMASRS